MKSSKLLVLVELSISIVAQAQVIEIVKRDFEEVPVLPFAKPDVLKVIPRNDPVLFEKQLEKQINAEQGNKPVSAAILTSNLTEAFTKLGASKSMPSLAIRSGERLMPMLKKWLADQNVELVWAANAQTAGRVRDVVFEDDFESSSADISVALTEVLSPFGFEAEISTNASMRRVTVRNLRGNL